MWQRRGSIENVNSPLTYGGGVDRNCNCARDPTSDGKTRWQSALQMHLASGFKIRNAIC